MCVDCSEVNFLILDIMYYHDMDLVHTKKWLVAIIFLPSSFFRAYLDLHFLVLR
jgi:membrane-bound acyltransferase YfiQ involved in biofilm formation